MYRTWSGAAAPIHAPRTRCIRYRAAPGLPSARVQGGVQRVAREGLRHVEHRGGRADEVVRRDLVGRSHQGLQRAKVRSGEHPGGRSRQISRRAGSRRYFPYTRMFNLEKTTPCPSNTSTYPGRDEGACPPLSSGSVLGGAHYVRVAQACARARPPASPRLSIGSSLESASTTTSSKSSSICWRSRCAIRCDRRE